MKSIILVPSYNRAQLLKRFLKSYVDTETTTPCLILVDHNDPKKDEYQSLEYPQGCTLVMTEGRTMGAKCREVATQFMHLDAVCLLNDDHILRTNKWDAICFSQINTHNIIATNDNYMAPRKLAGATVYSCKILRTLNWPIFPPWLEHLYIDDLYEMITSRAQCATVLMNVLVEHDHAFKHGKEDETHIEVYGPEFKHGKPGGLWVKDKENFERWLNTDANADCEKVVALQPKQGVMIATPSHDGNCALGYALGLSDFAISLAQQNVYFEMARVVGSSLVPHARNSLVDMFLKSKCQKLLFVDSDQSFDRSAGWALLNSPRRIIAGVTPHKRFPLNLNFEPLDKDQAFFKDLTNKSWEEFQTFTRNRADKLGEIEVNRSGTGFIMVDRSVFELMAEHVDEYLAFDFNLDVKHKEYFKFGINSHRRYSGEDWHFCELAKKLGIPIYINTRCVVAHQGTFNFQAG